MCEGVLFSQLQEKDVINICDGQNLGNITDLVLDLKGGLIMTIVVEEGGRCVSFLSKTQGYFIPWCAIKKIGEDIILIEVEHIEKLFRPLD